MASSPARPVADRRAGFSLIELLAALVISGVIVGALFQLLSGQGRFVEMQSAREEVQQNARAALELIGTELRTLPAGESLVRANRDSITFRTPRFWGVVCGIPSPTSVEVALPSIAGTSFSVNAGTGAVLNLGTAGAPLWTAAVGVISIGNASGACDGTALPAGVEGRLLTLSAQPMNGAATPAIGNNLYLYDQVTYRTGTSASVPGLWIQRRLGEGSSANQPMAGPVDESGGLMFAYYNNDSPNAIATPILTAATRESVNRVMVVVRAISRNSVGDVQETKADTVIISLRNRL